MRLCVYGAGAVGGHLAARLITADVAAVSVVTRGAHLAAIRANGLVLTSGGRAIRGVPAVATDNPADLDPQDILLVTLKAPSIPSEAAHLARLLAPGGWAVFLANGVPWWWNHGLDSLQRPLRAVDPAGELWTLVTPQRALGGVVRSANVVVAPGRIVHSQYDHWIIGEPDGSFSSRLEETKRILALAGLNVKMTSDIRRAIWSKLVVNAAVNSVSALTRSPIDSLARDARVRHLLVRIMREVIEIGAALGWDIRMEVNPERLVQRLEDGIGIKPSMLQDVEKQRPMEVDALLGELQSFARTHEVDTPVIDIVLPLLYTLDASRTRSPRPDLP